MNPGKSSIHMADDQIVCCGNGRSGHGTAAAADLRHFPGFTLDKVQLPTRDARRPHTHAAVVFLRRKCARPRAAVRRRPRTHHAPAVHRHRCERVIGEREPREGGFGGQRQGPPRHRTAVRNVEHL